MSLIIIVFDEKLSLAGTLFHDEIMKTLKFLGGIVQQSRNLYAENEVSIQ